MASRNVRQSDGKSTMRRASRNFGKLARGRGVAAILELLSVALVARSLSPAAFGNIVLIQTYVLIIRGLFHFKLNEVVVRFGVPLLEADKHQSLRRLLKITLLVDFASTAIAAVVAALLATLTGKIMGWDGSVAPIAMLYSCVLLTYGFGTAKGVLRMFDRYDVLGVQIMIGPILRLIGVVLVILLNPTVLLFVVALMVATVSENAYLIAKGWAELRRQIGAVPLTGYTFENWRNEYPGLGKFIAVMYWQGNVDTLPRHVSTLLAGALLGSAGAGLLRLAREATKILSTPGALLRQVIFPDLVRMWTRRASAFGFILARAVLISALLGLVFIVLSIVGGAALFSAALGAGYAQAANLTSLLLVAATIELMANVLRAAGYATGDAGKILRLHVFSTVLYLVLFVTLTPATGLIGPGIAACLASLVPLAGTGLLVLKRIRKQQASIA